MKVTPEAVEKEVRKLALAKPDYVYDPPANMHYSYVRDGSGEGKGHGCIIGQALRELGADMDKIAEWERRPGDISSSVGTMFPALFEQPATRFLKRVQAIQDSFGTWGHAVEVADGESR